MTEATKDQLTSSQLAAQLNQYASKADEAHASGDHEAVSKWTALAEQTGQELARVRLREWDAFKAWLKDNLFKTATSSARHTFTIRNSDWVKS